MGLNTMASPDCVGSALVSIEQAVVLARGREWDALERSIDVQISRLRRNELFLDSVEALVADGVHLLDNSAALQVVVQRLLALIDAAIATPQRN